jgi:hypothetical protein
MHVAFGEQVLGTVQRLIDGAQEGSHLRLVSGFLDPGEGIRQALADAAQKRRVKITLIVRGGRKEKQHGLVVSELGIAEAEVHYLPWLHAKLYLSDTEAIATSMNLTQNKEYNKGEVAVCVQRSRDPDGYRQLESAFQHFLEKAESHERDRAAKAPAGAKRASRSAVQAPLAQEGHCIRCAVELALNPEKPLCSSCHLQWKVYKNPDYREKFCHGCGKEKNTTLAKPLCRSCFAGS